MANSAIDLKHHNDMYLRKVSKYEIDRMQIDFDKLNKDKIKERTMGNKMAKEDIDRDIHTAKVKEVLEKDAKISFLHTIKER